MRKVFIDGLRTKADTRIYWDKTIGNTVEFEYDHIKGFVEIIGYDNKYLTVLYNGEKSKITPCDFKRCMFCKLLNLTSSYFKIEINTEFKDNKRDMTILEREYRPDDKHNNWRYYKYICNKCGYVGWSQEGNLLKGKGCSCCCPAPRTVVEGINSIVDTDPWMIKFFQGGYDEAKLYTFSSNKKIIPICPECGDIKNNMVSINKIHQSNSIGCYCSDGKSYAHKFMYAFLKQLNVDFINEYSPKWANLKRYDFYIPNDDIIIEVDGGWHFKDNAMSGITQKQSKETDAYKDIKAQENGITVIRIPCRISIMEKLKENILLSKLNQLYDLSHIKWLECEEFALCNLVKIACDYKKDNPNLSAREIGKIMNVYPSTIIVYLKQGTQLNWCYYNAKEEKSKSSSNNGKNNGRRVEIFKDNNSLGVFQSIQDLENNSNVLFGVRLTRLGITEVCCNNKTTYKGFSFKYVNTNRI